MKIFIRYFLVTIFVTSAHISAQSSQNIGNMDEDFLNSLPDQVREDVLSEIDNNANEEEIIQRRPSTKLSKLNTIKEWEKFKKIQSLESESERYGLRMFNTMQSSFMPLSEPNFGDNYIVDFGDVLQLQFYGATENIGQKKYITEVQRDGTIILEDIGSLMIGGQNFEQATKLIESKYSDSFIGLDVVVTLSKIRDINVLVTGNVEFPGIYTLSGNSNILQALNVAGGPNEDGSLRKILIKRKNKPDQSVDLYQALIFGDIENIPFLMSGDSIHVESVKNLVRAGYGFNKTAVFEMKNGETIQDLINFAGGLKIEALDEQLRLVRFSKNSFESMDINMEQYQNYKLQNLDSIYALKEDIGVVTISGNVNYPGKYSISSSDKLSDIIARAGGYNDSAYPFASSLLRESTKELEAIFIEKSYQNLITFVATNPQFQGGGSGEGLNYILSEIKAHVPVGRIVAEFDLINLDENPDKNIFLRDKDQIHVPSYDSNVYIFGEIGNPGAIFFDNKNNVLDYIDKSGGFTKFSSQESIFIVSPNGETQKVHANGFKKFISQDYDIYPGSVIYVPRDIGKIEGLNYYATIAPIFSSLALSVASLNSIND
tara:strand:- start:2371 stop:4173 length:1803 start_codon:yes stop_codon:yes gene_type:complete